MFVQLLFCAAQRFYLMNNVINRNEGGVHLANGLVAYDTVNV